MKEATQSETPTVQRLKELFVRFSDRVSVSDKHFDDLPWVREARQLKAASSSYDPATWPQSGEGDITDPIAPSLHLLQVSMTKDEESFLIDNGLVVRSEDATLVSTYEALLREQEARLSNLALKASALRIILSERDQLKQMAWNAEALRRRERDEIINRNYKDRRLKDPQYDFSKPSESHLPWLKRRRLNKLHKLAKGRKQDLITEIKALDFAIYPFRSLRLLADHSFAKISSFGWDVFAVIREGLSYQNCPWNSSAADVVTAVKLIDSLRNSIPPIVAAVIYLRFGESVAFRLFARTKRLTIPANTQPEIFFKCARLEAMAKDYSLEVYCEFSPCGCEGGQTSKDYCYFTCPSCNGSGGTYSDVLKVVED